MELEAPVCFCGSETTLRSNSLIYNGKTYGNGLAWICNRFPECRGSVGTHPDGKPLGTIPDAETKKLRQIVHSLIDPLWKSQTERPKAKARGSVYGYLGRIMGLSAPECHIGMFDREMCLEAIEKIADNPYLPHLESEEEA